MLRRLRPTLEAFGDWETVRALTEEALARGSAAHRLRGVAEEEGLLACVETLVAETRGERRKRPAAKAVRRPVAVTDAAPPGAPAPYSVGTLGG